MAIHGPDRISHLLWQRPIFQYIEVLFELIHGASSKDNGITQIWVQYTVECCPSQRSSVARDPVLVSGSTGSLKSLFQLWLAVIVAVQFTHLKL